MCCSCYLKPIFFVTIMVFFISFLLSISFFSENIDFKSIKLNEVKYMIESGADVNEIDPSTTFTVLMEAAYNTDNPKIIDLLVANGARISATTKDGITALMWSSYVNTNEYVTYSLLKAGSNVNVRDKYGITPLLLAAYNNTNVEVIKLLIQYGADIHAKDNYFERTPIMWAAVNNTNPDIIQLLIDNKSDVNACDRYFTTPIMRAARSNKNSQVIKQLILNGADISTIIPESKYNYFETSLDFIYPQWIPNIVKDNSHLESHNVSGMNALMFAACDNDSIGIIQILLSHGIAINQTDDMGNTPLMYAAWNNQNPVVISFLLENGANPKLKNKQNMTALDFVEYDNNVAIRSSDVYFNLKQATMK